VNPQTVNTSINPWLRTFLIIFTGQAFSLLGSYALNFALVWWITAQTGSAALLAYAAIAAILPQALLGLVVGPFIDRWDRRFTMIFADLFVAATSLALLALFAAGTPAVWLVIAVIAFRSIGAAFHTPASQAAVPMYVPQEHLMRVAGWNFFLGSGVAMVAPVLGAFLIGIAPIAAVIWLDVAGALLAVASLLLVKIPHPARSEPAPAGQGFIGGLKAEFLEGWRELIRHQGLLELTFVLVAVTLIYMPISALFPLMTLEHFGGDALRWSLTEFAFGTGMLGGSLVVGFLSQRFSAVNLVGAGILVVGGMIGVSGLLPSSGFWIFAGLCVLMGFGAPLFGAPLTALFQSLIEPSKLGRVMALYMTMAMIASPAGLIFAGPVAERVGIAVWFAVSGLLVVLVGLLVWALPAIRHLNRSNPAGGRTPGSGPAAAPESQEAPAEAAEG
jgi:DHA3 family macrolide efflux protein-like MFS transporter